MPKAKSYIYRNLRTECFSRRFRGKVVEHLTHPVIFYGEFQVSASGRTRVLATKQKNVHAFITTRSDMQPYTPEQWPNFDKREVTYNPYKHDSFVFKDTEKPVEGSYLVVADYPRVYVLLY